MSEGFSPDTPPTSNEGVSSTKHLFVARPVVASFEAVVAILKRKKKLVKGKVVVPLVT
ncbi:hypothetical protein DEO72_LG7g1849 [Vigna unguiculata]|uniref:Uncharacterized protein n=1 Tax=Vigna unguiculata TaxID=3917 RepID=A0A4D6MK23_VIGUN|nr:hypothetical protein DEO72_LG7g1849 [Vigna unguiculata]